MLWLILKRLSLYLKKIAALYQCVYEKKGPGVSMVTVYQNA